MSRSAIPRLIPIPRRPLLTTNPYRFARPSQRRFRNKWSLKEWNDQREEDKDYTGGPINRAVFLGLIGMSIIGYIADLDYWDVPEEPPPSFSSSLSSSSSPTPTTIDDDHDLIATGTTTIPFFPRHITLPSFPSSSPGPHKPFASAALPAGLGAAEETEEYSLLGLGIRTVSFLRIQVYVVGLYVCKSDLPKLQAAMIKAVAGEGASTLVDDEKTRLRKILLDGEESVKVWDQVFRNLGEAGIRGAVRIVPTRNTDIGHMREGFVRMVTAGGKREGSWDDDQTLQTSLKEFSEVMGGKRAMGKGKCLLLGRGAEGGLSAWMEAPEDEAKGGMAWMGGVTDERISRYLWMGYLAGENVASAGARESVVDGVVELVERPIGTVETQVV